MVCPQGLRRRWWRRIRAWRNRPDRFPRNLCRRCSYECVEASMQKTVVALTVLLSATLAYAGHDFTERTEKSFPLAANGRLVVRSEIGDIRIHASDRRDVKIVAVKRARDASDDEGARRVARMHLNFAASANEVRVTVEWPSRSISALLRNESNL